MRCGGGQILLEEDIDLCFLWIDCNIRTPFLATFLNFFNTPFLIIVQGLVGILNAFLWPSMIGIIGMWFPKKSRGFIGGLWATCNNTGNIVAI